MAETDEKVEQVEPETPGEPLVEEAERVETTTPPGEPAKPKSGELEYSRAVQRRIDQLTREKHEERRRAEALGRENEALKRRTSAGPRPTPPDPRTFATETGEIDPAKWQTAISAYEDKLHSWRQAQEPARVAESEPSEPQPDAAASAAAFLERAALLRAKHADFDEVVNRPVFSPEMVSALYDSDHGPEIAYFLGKNQTEAAKIAGLPPAQQYRELGRLEARFTATGERRSVSAAPEPITPVTGTAGTITKDPDTMSIDEYMAWEAQRRLERRKNNPFAGA